MARSRMQKTMTVAALAMAAVAAMAAVPGAAAQSQYDQGVAGIENQYDAARARCKQMVDDTAQDICIAEAKATAKFAKARLKVNFNNTPDTRYDAAIVQAEGQYSVDRARCKLRKGNERDLCRENAKIQFKQAKDYAKRSHAFATGGQ